MSARLRFTRLIGDRDCYLWQDLTNAHGRHGGWERTTECEHGLIVTTCFVCGAPIQIHGPAECEHLVAALNAIPIGSAALVNRQRVEWDEAA
jgi:hypothetical protein